MVAAKRAQGRRGAGGRGGGGGAPRAARRAVLLAAAGRRLDVRLSRLPVRARVRACRQGATVGSELVSAHAHHHNSLCEALPVPAAAPAALLAARLGPHADVRGCRVV